MLSIAAPPFESMIVPVPASSGYNCSVSATNPPLAEANTVSSINGIATKIQVPADQVTAVVPVTRIEPA